MTAITDPPLLEMPMGRRGGRIRQAAAVWVDAPPFEQAVGLLLGTLSAAIIALLATLVLISPVQHFTAQNALFDQFRLTLAEGSVPVGPVTPEGDLVEPGIPIAMFTSGEVSVHEEIIVQGTGSAQTMQGIGHRRDTPLPCQPGVGVLMARATSYGGTGSQWARLQPGQQFTITTGQGTCAYTVSGQRRAGDAAPAAPTAGKGALVLTTAAGLPYMPNEVLRVDATLNDTPFEPAAVTLPSAALPEVEKALAVDNTPAVVFGLILQLQLLVGAVIAVTWMWRRWGRWQTWVFAVPILATLAVLTANTLNQLLLPNLL